MQALVRGLKTVFENYLACNKKIPQEFVTAVRSMTDPARLADTVAGQLSLKMEDKQDLLERTSLKERIEKLLELMQSEIEIAEIEKKIRDRVKKQMEKSQKEVPTSTSRCVPSRKRWEIRTTSRQNLPNWKSS